MTGVSIRYRGGSSIPETRAGSLLLASHTGATGPIGPQKRDDVHVLHGKRERRLGLVRTVFSVKEPEDPELLISLVSLLGLKLISLGGQAQEGLGSVLLGGLRPG